MPLPDGGLAQLSHTLGNSTEARIQRGHDVQVLHRVRFVAFKKLGWR
jgi:hypothetical protein